MSLPVCLLLVTLALCFCEVDAALCPAAVIQHVWFFVPGDRQFQSLLEKFNAPLEAVEAKMAVKKCTDHMSLVNRLKIGQVLGKIALKCGL
ncbi:secretoglobin family 1D member 2-like [Nycticebus coucang]|uniref:secretoglobin family 1D member 2-like n=1 Tax=Nycticebus coucang TaxID=9470 RepID=UPI00234E2602|nr:secretoglobin family 1D member 2-like [Nycticebus coucang]